MNPFILLLLVMGLFGLIDKLLNGRFGVAEAFDRGMDMMGGMMISVVGIYSIGVTIIRANAENAAKLASLLPFDPSIFAGALLAPDMGGYPISMSMAATREIGLFFGIFLSSSLGAEICFQIPIFLSTLKKDDTAHFLKGTLIGIIAVPFVLASGALLIGMPAAHLAANMAPVVTLCLLLAAALKFAERASTAVLRVFGEAVKIASYAFFAMAMASLFVPGLELAPSDVIIEACVIVVKMIIIIAGSLVFTKLVFARLEGPIGWAARALCVNRESVMGLLLCTISCVAMLPLFPSMDRRGKIMNAAFSATTAYILGGQMAFIVSVEPELLVRYLAAKLFGGLCALLIARFYMPVPREYNSGTKGEC